MYFEKQIDMAVEADTNRQIEGITVTDKDYPDVDGPRLGDADPAGDLAVRLADCLRDVKHEPWFVGAAYSLTTRRMEVHVRSDYFSKHYHTDIVVKPLPKHGVIEKTVEIMPGCAVFCLQDCEFKMVGK